MILIFLFLLTNLIASVNYQYTKTPVNLDRLTYEIKNSTISRNLERIDYSSPTLNIWFYDSLTSGDQALLDQIVINHNGEPLPQEPEKVKIDLGPGAYERIKYKGYTFIASSNSITNFDFTMPFDGYIQGGYFSSYFSSSGDMMEFIILPDTPYEYKYVETLYLTPDTDYLIKEDFAYSSLISSGTPMRIVYDNKGDEKRVNFVIIYRLKE